MRRKEDDFAAYRQQQNNRAAPFSYIYPQMPPRFRWCRRFAQALFLIEWGGFVVLVLSNFPAGVVALLWGKKALLEGVGAMAFLLSLVSFALLPLAFLARWLRHTAKLFWHCPCCGQPFPYYAPDGRHEEMRNKECCYTLRQMRIGYVKTKLCPLVIPSECPAGRRKFFKMENICTLDRYDDSVSEKVLALLLEWACYGQHMSGLVMGRRKIAEIPQIWLKAHLLNVVKGTFDYFDYWNYRRLLEVVVELIPELKDAVLSINSGTTDPDLIEIIDDYRDM